MTIDSKDLRALLFEKKAASVATHTSPTIHAAAAASEKYYQDGSRQTI